MNLLSAKTIKLSDVAHWDEARGQYHVLLQGSDTFAALIILKDAPLPLAHLDRSGSRPVVKLGENLHERLEGEVKDAIARGAHQVATGLSLATHAEMAVL